MNLGNNNGKARPVNEKRKRTNCSFEFLTFQETLLIMELTSTKAKSERFMRHIFENYGAELRKEQEERAALRASFGYPR